MDFCLFTCKESAWKSEVYIIHNLAGFHSVVVITPAWHIIWLHLQENIGLPRTFTLLSNKEPIVTLPYPLVKHRSSPSVFYFINILLYFFVLQFVFSLHYTCFQVLSEITPYPWEKMTQEMTVMESSSGCGNRNSSQNKSWPYTGSFFLRWLGDVTR